MAKNSNCNSYISEEDLVLAKNENITYTSTSGCCGDNDMLSEDVDMPFGFWVITQYGNASKRHRFTANAPGAHIDGGTGKYTISVNGSKEITLHLYDDVAHDEIYTKTGTSFEATDIPELIYNRDYSFIFTKGMDSSDLFEVRVDYRTQTVVDSNEHDCYNCDCYNCNYDVPVQGIAMCYSSYSMKVNDTVYLQYNIIPSNASNKLVTWHSSNPSVAKIDASTGKITAKSAGTAKITATSVDGNYTTNCDVWVKGKTPVFLIHGRISNSFETWGACNKIYSNPFDNNDKDNNHYNPLENAYSVGSNPVQYINPKTQELSGYKLAKPIVVDGEEVMGYEIDAVFNGKFEDGKYTSTHPEGGNLAYYLKNKGYKENVNLFVFNYPNEDAVVHNAKKFKKYIENLIDYVRTSGTQEVKCCFYRSTEDYNKNNFKISIVGHSMGGLVARYSIENLNMDNQVEKLITICTPHWGSGYAGMSNDTGFKHVLCDHDLDQDSAMLGGDLPLNLNCDGILKKCHTGSYILSDELQYSCPRDTLYYAIAGITYFTINLLDNNHEFEIPTNFISYQQIGDYMNNNGLYQIIDGFNVGDNVVGLISQIGWTENEGSAPNKRIYMQKILINADTNGGNIELLDHLHGKMPHRENVMQYVYNYLNE